jgi:hypothetical protein
MRRACGRRDTRCLTLVLLLVISTACARPPRAPSTPKFPILARFDCGDVAVSARFDRESVTLAWGGRTLTLPQTISASGARYATASALFWNKGRDATFETGGVTRTCHVVQD